MRIMSYNTRGSLGMDNVRSTRRIVDTVRMVSPDVICFQEIHKKLIWSRREDQPLELGSYLSRRFIFQRNVRFGMGAYGIGIAARGQVVSITEHTLPGGREQRGVLEVALKDVGGLRNVTVFCTHFGLGEQERVGQAEALAGYVGAVKWPVIVCGDFNEGPEGEAIKLLLIRTRLVDADAGENRPTFQADNPTVRIDYCFVSQDLKVENVEVPHSLASDHLPLVVDVTQQ